MKNSILLAIIFSVFTGSFVKGQLGQFGPVLQTQWKFSTKKINDCEYDLIFTVSIDKGKHISSVTKPKNAGPEIYPTELVFKSNKGYTLVGSVTETKPTSEYDPTLKKTVLIHYNKAVFTQRIKLTTADKVKITGTYKYQICDNDKCEYPPKEDFNFDLQGTPGCSVKK